MNKKNLLVNFLFIIAVLIIVFTAWGFLKGNKKPAAQVFPQILETDPKRGSEEAKVTIVEFGDFQCSYCRSMYDVFNQVRSEYGEKVRFVWKDFPLIEIHSQALNAAQAGRCAQKQGKFWEMHDLLFQNQDKLSDAVYLSLAQQSALDQNSFLACYSNHETIDLIEQNVREGQSLGVMGTPHFYINNIVAEEVISFDQLKEIIDSEL